MTYSAVILAAGESGRFGENKLLQPFGDSTIIHTVVEKFTRPDIQDIMVITGAYADAISVVLTDPKIQCFFNTDFATGMSSSIRLAAAHVPSNVDAVVITPGDMPAFDSDTVGILLNRFDPGTIVIPRYEMKKGHPVVLDRRIFGECLTFEGEKILYGVIQRHAGQIRFVDVADEGVLLDIDTRSDYERLVRRSRKGGLNAGYDPKS